MTLPPLYLEGLFQKARQGQRQLDAYKVGLMEAILRDGLRATPRPCRRPFVRPWPSLSGSHPHRLTTETAGADRLEPWLAGRGSFELVR